VAASFRSAVRAGPGPASMCLYRLEGSKNNAFEIIKQECDSPQGLSSDCLSWCLRSSMWGLVALVVSLPGLYESDF